jgi:CheY-like chemotaxis protein
LANRPDFITADYRIVGGTGVAAVEAITALLGPIPVVFITGSVSCLGSSSRAPVIDKPIMPCALARALRLAVGGQSPEGDVVRAVATVSTERKADSLRMRRRSLLDGPPANVAIVEPAK